MFTGETDAVILKELEISDHAKSRTNAQHSEDHGF
jgi:hypothetical protein